jgi:hypothetical protein
MNKNQSNSGKGKDRKGKWLAYSILGLIYGTLVFLGIHRMKKHQELADDELTPAPDVSLSEIKLQLDRIEKTIRKR